VVGVETPASSRGQIQKYLVACEDDVPAGMRFFSDVLSRRDVIASQTRHWSPREGTAEIAAWDPQTGGRCMSEPLFRFAPVRAPQRLTQEALDRRVTRTHPVSDSATSLYTDLRTLRSTHDYEGMRSRARSYVSSPQLGFAASLDDLATPIAGIDRWLRERHDRASFDDLEHAISAAFGAGPASAVGLEDFRRDRHRVGDSVLALTLVNDSRRLLPELVRGIRVFGLLERVGADEQGVARPGAIRDALRATVALPGDLFPIPSSGTGQGKAIEAAYKRRTDADAARSAEKERLANRLRELSTAIDEVSAGYDVERRTRLSLPALQEPSDSRDEGREATPTERRETSNGAFHVPTRLGASPFFLSEDVTRRVLTDATKRLLRDDLRFDLKAIDVPLAVLALEREVGSAARNLYPVDDGSDMVLIGTTLVSARPGPAADWRGDVRWPVTDLCAAPTTDSPTASPEPLPAGPGRLQGAGIADLLVVEQQLKRYELGELAHIENVLAGEFRERTHRRARKTEETTLLESEVTEETERDLQSTERYELQTETARVINEDTSIQAGLTVSGKYGPISSFEASAGYASDTSVEESTRNATSYARDVTERASSRVQQRVLERRARVTIEEFEETNIHRVDNVGGAHSIGLYRWVDKLYRAEIANYGRRAMLEFVVPQPSAFLKHAMTATPIEGLEVEKPQPPGYCDPATGFHPLSADDITSENYVYFVGKYHASGVSPPPPRYTVVGATLEKEPTAAPPVPGYQSKTDAKVVVPEGYVGKTAWLNGLAWTHTDGWAIVFIGRNIVQQGADGFFNDVVQLNDEEGTVPVAIGGTRMDGYALAVEVLCERTSNELAAWQLATYTAIISSYEDLKSEYENRLAAIRLQQGIPIEGRNPLTNRQLIEAELKRSVLSIITDQHFDSLDSLRWGVSDHGYPQLDLDEVSLEAPYIRFFEQAFEWEHMTYVFYPYYWGRKDGWMADALFDDTDPLFGQFLRAGAARVLVPARPAFEAAICSYLNTGWPLPDEADPPCVDEHGTEATFPWLSIVDEIRAQQGYDASPGEGTINVTQGDSTVVGVGTAFDEERDVNREIHIAGVKYRIVSVTSGTDIELSSTYRDPSATGLPYALGVRYMGLPWEVRVPTSLVALQQDSNLPVFA
jgi:hypothetical protein